MATIQMSKATGYPYKLLNVYATNPGEQYTLIQNTVQDMMFTPTGKMQAAIVSMVHDTLKEARHSEDEKLMVQTARKALNERIRQRPELMGLLVSSGRAPIVSDDQVLVNELTMIRGAAVQTGENTGFSEMTIRKLYRGLTDMFLASPSSLLDLPLANVTLETLKGMVKNAGRWPPDNTSAALPMPPEPILGAALVERVIANHSMDLYTQQKYQFQIQLLKNHLFYLKPGATMEIADIVARMEEPTKQAIERLSAMYDLGQLDPAVVGNAAAPDERLLHSAEVHAPVAEAQTMEIAEAPVLSFAVPQVLTFTGGPVTMDGVTYDTPMHYGYATVMRRLYSNFGMTDLNGLSIPEMHDKVAEMTTTWIAQMRPNMLWLRLTKYLETNASALASLLATGDSAFAWKESDSFTPFLADMMGQLREHWRKTQPPPATKLTIEDIAAADFFYLWLEEKARVYTLMLTAVPPEKLYIMLKMDIMPAERAPKGREVKALGSEYNGTAWNICYHEFKQHFHGKELRDAVTYCISRYVKHSAIPCKDITPMAKTVGGTKFRTLIQNPIMKGILSEA
ncbi:unknown protein [Grouper iridovirus]|uniref:Uncharacterized protein n=1 Tax=Grouper iridovirus TaxID=127569 RepID=Q5GAK6_9VIRU|nr:unknown protein [Grouper iridovirus]